MKTGYTEKNCDSRRTVIVVSTVYIEGIRGRTVTVVCTAYIVVVHRGIRGRIVILLSTVYILVVHRGIRGKTETVMSTPLYYRCFDLLKPCKGDVSYTNWLLYSIKMCYYLSLQFIFFWQVMYVLCFEILIKMNLHVNWTGMHTEKDYDTVYM